jgi:SET domain-containing protein
VVTNPDVKKLINKLCHTTPEGFYISDHPVNLGMSYYVNHTDQNPNVAYCKNRDSYHAIRDIKKDEELLTVYELGEQDWLI